jgi:Na+-driven multidrug efflux pump
MALEYWSMACGLYIAVIVGMWIFKKRKWGENP